MIGLHRLRCIAIAYNSLKRAAVNNLKIPQERQITDVRVVDVFHDQGTGNLCDRGKYFELLARYWPRV